MSTDPKSLAAEIEARAVKAQAGLARAYELIADQYGTWSPENGTQFTDHGAAEAVEGIRLARELLAEVAALQGRAFEDGARWMRERTVRLAEGEVCHGRYRTWSFWSADAHGERGNRDEASELARHSRDIAAAIAALPLQPEGERNDR